MHEDRHGRPDDVALVRMVASGSYDALASLYDRHGAAVFAAASRLTSDRGVAEEVVQETFLALWNRAETFDPAAGPGGLAAHDRPQPDGRPPSGGRPPTAVRRAAIDANVDDAETQLLERAATSGTIVAGSVAPDDPEVALASKETARLDRAGPRRHGDRGANGDPPGLPRGPDPDGDRRAARMAARHGQDTDPAGAAAPARGPRRRIKRCRPDPAKTVKDDDGSRRGTRTARTGGGGAGRPRAADGRRHADGPGGRRPPRRLPDCTHELVRLRRVGGARPRRGRATPSPDLRARTLASSVSTARPRGPALAPDAAAGRDPARRRGRDRPRRSRATGRGAPGLRAGSPPSPRPSSCPSSRPPLIVGSRVDDQLAAQDAAIEDLEDVTTATLQVTAEPDAERVALAESDRGRGQRHPRLLAVDHRARGRRRRADRARRPARNTAAGSRSTASVSGSARCSSAATSPTGSGRRPAVAGLDGDGDVRRVPRRRPTGRRPVGAAIPVLTRRDLRRRRRSGGGASR